MSFFKSLAARIRETNQYSKTAAWISFYTMLCLYAAAGFAYITASYAQSYHRAVQIYSGLLEAAPASLAAGLCAAILCDMAYASRHR